MAAFETIRLDRKRGAALRGRTIIVSVAIFVLAFPAIAYVAVGVVLSMLPPAPI